MRKTLTIVMAALLLGAAGVAVAKEKDDAADKRRDKHMKALAEKRGDKWLLVNDNISIWFHTTSSGKAKPMLKVFATDADGNLTGYKFKVKRLCEVAENATSCSGAYTKINLDKADHWNTEITRDEANSTVTIRMLLSDANGIVGLVFHLRDDAPAVKFDLEVANWRWKEPTALGLPGVTTHRLLLEMTVDEKGGDIDEEDAEDARVGVKDGYVSWEPNATATYAGGMTKQLNVTAFVHGDDGEDEREGRIALRFDGDGGYRGLLYDPTLGVASASAGGSFDPIGVPSAGLVAAVAAVGAAAVVATRRFR